VKDNPFFGYLDYYIFIRMFSSDDEDDSRPFYPYHVHKEGGGLEWRLTRDFDEAANFKSADIAKRIVKSVTEFKTRIDRGWGYQVVKVSEECLETNINFFDEEKEVA